MIKKNRILTVSLILLLLSPFFVADKCDEDHSYEIYI